MPQNITKEWLAGLLSKNDIVSVVTPYVQLNRQGSNFFGRCPFHNEKTGSFSVNPRGQYFKCFGCGAGGDAITFIRMIEKLEFVEAVKKLADKSGMEIPETENPAAAALEKKQRDAILAALKAAAHYFHKSLYTETGADALNYLRNRGIEDALITKFGLGYCPPGDALYKGLLSNSISAADMGSAGLAYARGGAVISVFAGRVVVPIIDVLGRVVAFGGRALDNDPAKYKNSNNNAVFNKSHSLFAVNLLKNLKNIDYILLAEGYMDVIALHKAGYCNSVASMGTSLTRDQARLLARFCKDVYICYDGDSAGQDAALRGLSVLKDEGLSVRVVSLPDGLDPDDMIQKRGRDAFQKCIDGAQPFMEYRLSALSKKYDLSKPDEKSGFAVAAVKIITGSGGAVEQEEYLRYLSRLSGYSIDSLTAQARRGAASDDVKTALLPASQTAAADKAVAYILAAAARGFADLLDFQNLRDYLSTDAQKTLFDALNAGIPAAAAIAGCESEAERSALMDIVGNALLIGRDEEIADDARRHYKNLKKESGKRMLEELNKKIDRCSDPIERSRLFEEYKL
ncbi:MAG: DNA primase, partial [Firmicutes bacterium]|nr:DNA primase [Bacillota bacterium]